MCLKAGPCNFELPAEIQHCGGDGVQDRKEFQIALQLLLCPMTGMLDPITGAKPAGLLGWSAACLQFFPSLIPSESIIFSCCCVL